VKEKGEGVAFFLPHLIKRQALAMLTHRGGKGEKECSRFRRYSKGKKGRNQPLPGKKGEIFTHYLFSFHRHRERHPLLRNPHTSAISGGKKREVIPFSSIPSDKGKKAK